MPTHVLNIRRKCVSGWLPDWWKWTLCWKLRNLLNISSSLSLFLVNSINSKIIRHTQPVYIIIINLLLNIIFFALSLLPFLITLMISYIKLYKYCINHRIHIWKRQRLCGSRKVKKKKKSIRTCVMKMKIFGRWLVSMLTKLTYELLFKVNVETIGRRKVL